MQLRLSRAILGVAFLVLASGAWADGWWLWHKPGTPTSITLPAEDVLKIGAQIWQNECAGTVEGLTSWNRGENFASLGIGHFIWYPAGIEGPFEESWPKLVQFLRAKSIALPIWILQERHCPWRNHEEFQRSRDGAQMRELRAFLARTVEAQTEFIVQRLRSALPKMVEAAGRDRTARRRLESQFQALTGSGQGMYAMIDYVNFKGEGTKVEERYRGQGWGLAQVLLEMRGNPRGFAAPWEFSESAKRVLSYRVRNAPRDESQWLQGWMNRCDTYKRPL